MIRIKNHKQLEIFDPWSFMSPIRRRMLDQSWPGLFKEEILCELPVSKFKTFFNDGFGRPTKELHTGLGMLILQQAFDLTDEETVNQLSYNIQWHYTLNISEESDSAKYVCPKTLWNIRNIVIENGLDSLLFECATNKLAAVFKVNTDKQRIDSVHIQSNMRRLGRIGIFAKSIHKFLVNLKRGHKELFDSVDESILDRYFSEQALGCFAMVKPSEARKTLVSVADDLFDLIERFKDYFQVTSMHSYKLLKRVLKEQCNLNIANDSKPVEIKKPKEIPSDSLQNPSDPDATYSGHKGQGYQIQVMETYTDTKDPEEKSKTLNLITHVAVEKACESDANALIPAIESTQKRGIGPEELAADSLYGSDDNYEQAQERGVELIAPTMGSTQKDKLRLSDFELSAKGQVVSCPQGHVPAKVKKKKRHSVGFAAFHCANCPALSNCPVKKGKKFYYLRFTKKELRLAERRIYEQSPEFKNRYRWRAGAEATVSEFDRRTGVKHLRVRGLKAVRFCATLKVIGVNLFRAAAVRKAANYDKAAISKAIATLNHAIFIIKEHFMTTLSHLKSILINSWQIMRLCS
ncbi:MAG: transposase [Deltaproteobacteria bacterium]|nr:transposase [Deltaproteobacteria bacterium]